MNVLLKTAMTYYRNMNRKLLLKTPSSYQHQYAVVGVGQHALTHLVPCLWQLGVPVKMFCAKGVDSAAKAAERWPGCTGTDSIDDVLNKGKITAVFVCTKPHLHASITQQLLNGGKHVFVEKPVGLSAGQLEALIPHQKKLICQPGLQRRFAPVTLRLKRLLKDVISYNYRFYTGPYPEGDALYDIFIHPVDYVLQLFGAASIVHVSVVKRGGNHTYFMVLNHDGVRGSIEMSTNYSWQSAVDELLVNTASQTLVAAYPDSLKAYPKPKTLLNIPLDKINYSPAQQHQYIHHNFLPVVENNSLYQQGFYSELNHFVKNVERKRYESVHNLNSLLPVYKILDALKEL